MKWNEMEWNGKTMLSKVKSGEVAAGALLRPGHWLRRAALVQESGARVQDGAGAASETPALERPVPSGLPT